MHGSPVHWSSLIDITFITDHLPTGDEKTIAEDYAVSFGGNAVTAAFCCAKLGFKSDLIGSQANDWLIHMFNDMAGKYGIEIHGRKVRESSLSFIMPKGSQRAIVRCRDDSFLHPFPQLNFNGCRALHLDGYLPDAALHYAKTCREVGILTSLDGGAVRANTDELLRYIDIAIVSERFCEQMNLNAHQTLEYLRSRGCRIGGNTMGERGLIWYDEDWTMQVMPSLAVPLEKIVDTNGAGDVFHGAYIYSYLNKPDARWSDHFRFSRAASVHAIQHLGNEASLPSLENVQTANGMFPEAASAEIA